MTGTPRDWEVVLLGAWNVAILTPSGIVRRLFELDERTPIQVFVPLEGMEPIKVAHDDIVVSPSNSRLVVIPTACRGELLAKACLIAERALSKLPETPVSAAGVNLRFWFPAMPAELVRVFDSSLNDLCADAELKISSRKCRWSTVWQDGYLNLDLEQREDGSLDVLLNFHRSSTQNTELSSWVVRYPEMLEFAYSLLRDTLKLDIDNA